MGETIFIIANRPATRERLEAILSGAGYVIGKAEDGASAFGSGHAAPPDLVLVDTTTPDFSGLQMCARMNRGPATHRVPIIAITAQDVSHQEAALVRGADDVVTTPVDAVDLLARVTAILRVRHIQEKLSRSLAYLDELDAARRAQRHLAAGKTSGAPPVLPPAPWILMVDGDLFARSFYGGLLGEHGFQVVTVGTGSEALPELRRHPIEAVILDLRLPGMSGFAVLERLHAERPDLPVILFTAEMASEQVIGALTLGAFDFIVKGLRAEDSLVLAVHQAIRHRRDGRAIECERKPQKGIAAVGDQNANSKPRVILMP